MILLGGSGAQVKDKHIRIAWERGQSGRATDITGSLHRCSTHPFADSNCCEDSNYVALSSENVEYDPDEMIYNFSEDTDLRPYGLGDQIPVPPL